MGSCVRRDSLLQTRALMELLPHQRTGVDWLASHARGGLFDDMGLGKTVQAAVAADRVGAKRLLVVAPASLCHNWQREVSKWTRRRRVQVIRSGRDASRCASGES